MSVVGERIRAYEKYADETYEQVAPGEHILANAVQYYFFNLPKYHAQQVNDHRNIHIVQVCRANIKVRGMESYANVRVIHIVCVILKVRFVVVGKLLNAHRKYERQLQAVRQYHDHKKKVRYRVGDEFNVRQRHEFAQLEQNNVYFF
jgi:hypothetical protein